MVQIQRQWNNGLVVCSGRMFLPQLSGKTTHQLQQFHTNMNVEGQPESFYRQTLQSAESAAGSSAGGGAAAASPVFFSSRTIVGLTYVSAAGAAQFTAKASAGAESGRNAELEAKGRHGGNSFRLEPGNCHQLSNPHVMVKALRRRPHSGFFFRSSRKLEEVTPRYEYVLGVTQQEMLR